MAYILVHGMLTPKQDDMAQEHDRGIVAHFRETLNQRIREDPRKEM